jgi:iron(III) transport system ATP-binding protein
VAELRCEQISASYGPDHILAGVDLDVADATLTAILGASGSGKTTLLRVVMGFIRQDHGSVIVGGTVVSDGARVHLPPEKRSVGYVAQEGALYPQLTVERNIAFGLPRGERKLGRRARELLALVGLPDVYADRRPGQLSGGEQRRVALARALAPRPRVVLLDEPFSALDAALRAETREAVSNALAREGTTAVLVTHDQAEALSMGHEVAVLRSGRLVQTATPTALYRSPVDLEVARFVGDAVVLPGQGGAGHVECVLGRLPVHGSSITGPVQVMIRPEQVRMVRGSSPPERQGFAAKVTGHSYYGPETLVRLELDDGSRTALVARTFDFEAPTDGEIVHLAVVGPVAVYPPHAPPDTDPSPG